jgi:ABC-type branched-subunit amino acid transport system ATPase component
MIELLGIGVPREDGGWLLHRVCARIDAQAMTVVVARDPAQRQALFDVIGGRRLADEGRVWVDEAAVTASTRARIARRFARVDLGAPLAEKRTVLYNAVRAEQPLSRVLSIPAPGRRAAARRALALVRLDALAAAPAGALGPGARIRLRLAMGLVGQPRYLLTETTHLQGADVADEVRIQLRRLTDTARVAVLVGSVAADPIVRLADRVLAFANGLLVYDGPPAGFSAARA